MTDPTRGLPPTPEERSLMDQWGISDKEIDQAFEALSMSLADLVRMKQEEKAQQEGKDSFMIKVYKDMEAMVDNGRNVVRPEKTKRAKRVLGLNERQYVERSFQSQFDTWFPKNRHRFSTSVLVELKSTDIDRFYYIKIEPHQDKALRECATDAGVYHRIQSDPHMIQSRKPSDSMFIRNGRGYLAVMYRQKQRGQNVFYMVPYPKIVEEMERGEKSLTEQRAAEIGVRCTL